MEVNQIATTLKDTKLCFGAHFSLVGWGRESEA